MVSTLPRGVWSPEANTQRQIALSDTATAKALLALPPTNVFRRDVLGYCSLFNLIPHPQLLPYHPDEEEAQGADSSEALTSRSVYDLSDVEQVSIKYWQLDDGNCRAMCYALPFSTKVRSICLFNVGLNKKQLQLLCSTIPKTHVVSLQVDWNSIAFNKESRSILNGGKMLNSASSETCRPSPIGGTSKRTDQSESQMHEVGIQEHPEEEDSSEVFAQLLSEGSGLIILSLRANGITSRGAAALAKAVRYNKKLETLNLFQNSIDDAGARAFAHALPFNTTLKTLSLANNEISGCGAKFLIDGLTKYPAPLELLTELGAAESQIQIQMEQAKKGKKKTDRATVLTQLGLPIMETVDGVQYAPGNATLEELLLSGNAQIGPTDVYSLSETLELYQPKLHTHLRCIKLQRLPRLQAQKYVQHVSDFIIM